MSSEKDGRPGNRPGSAPEIQKLERVRCKLCGLISVHPIIIDGRCRSDVACKFRVERAARKAAKR